MDNDPIRGTLTQDEFRQYLNEFLPEEGGTVQPVEVGSDVTRDPRPAIVHAAALLNDAIRAEIAGLHDVAGRMRAASQFILAADRSCAEQVSA